ncbi:YtpR family tRNA-binding protein [Geomicrobium sp. JCM 19039]|uniref:YtpR family tRNA-binding protein n=1 Tax=Geomicrobium sp. JCM 19039 TaxID=1460636 RepID=UPI00045F4C31|nr:DUF4479 domain-containing protein [Geomicrobium sp. JCM 19039]GAK12976.1 phenylalanyl-tRNA synthetase beta chain [Geomicrobium sp. JCM 19039]
MNVFYNEKGIGDVLLVTLKEIAMEQREVERKGDIARLFHVESGETVGYHLFNVNQYGGYSKTGMLSVDDELIELMNRIFKENDWDHEFRAPTSSSFVVGHVDEIDRHPNADKLNVCQVNVGHEQLQIVCGAKNVDEGQRVVVALPGAYMPSGMKIRPSKLRGEPSNGMICSIKELAIPMPQEEPGILVLSEEYEIGEDFLAKYHQSV